MFCEIEHKKERKKIKEEIKRILMKVDKVDWVEVKRMKLKGKEVKPQKCFKSDVINQKLRN